MIPSTVSLIGLYQTTPNLFDDFVIPEAISDKKEMLIDNLLIRSSAFEILYPDADFMMFAIKQWSSKMLKVWEELYATTILEYDPIENYHRVEDWNESGNEKVKQGGSQTGEQNTTESGSGNGTTKTTSDSTTTANNSSVSSAVAFNSESFKNATKVEDNSSSEDNSTVDGTSNTEYNSTGTGNTTITRNLTDDKTNDSKRHGVIKGNIGVTTSQQMIEAQRLVVQFNIYDTIIADFISEFCITLY